MVDGRCVRVLSMTMMFILTFSTLLMFSGPDSMVKAEDMGDHVFRLDLDSIMMGDLTPVGKLGGYVYRHEHVNYNEKGGRSLYLATVEGYLLSINAGDLSLRWFLNLDNGTITTTPVALNIDASDPKSEMTEEVIILAGTEDGYLHFVHEQWVNNFTYVSEEDKIFFPNKRFSVKIGNDPVIDGIFFDDNSTFNNYEDDVLYVGTQGGTFCAISMDRTNMSAFGKIIWSKELIGEGFESFHMLTGAEDVTNTRGRMVTSNSVGQIFVMDFFSGRTVELQHHGFTSRSEVIYDAREEIILVSYNNSKGGINAYDMNTGTLKRSTPDRLFNETEHIMDFTLQQNTGDIYATGSRFSTYQHINEEGFVTCLRNNLTEKWRFNTSGVVMSKPTYHKKSLKIHFGDSNGMYYSIFSSDGRTYMLKHVVKTDMDAFFHEATIIQPIKPFSDYLNPMIYVPLRNIGTESNSNNNYICAFPTLEQVEIPEVPNIASVSVDTFNNDEGWNFNITATIEGTADYRQALYLEVNFPEGSLLFGRMVMANSGLYYFNSSEMGKNFYSFPESYNIPYEYYFVMLKNNCSTGEYHYNVTASGYFSVSESNFQNGSFILGESVEQTSGDEQDALKLPTCNMFMATSVLVGAFIPLFFSVFRRRKPKLEPNNDHKG